MSSLFQPSNRLALALILFFAVTTCVYVGACVSMANLVRVESLIDFEFQYRQQLLEIISGLKDAEIGARGYALTGKRTFLHPYEVAINSLPKQIADLRKISVPQTTEKEDVERLENKLTTQFVLLKKLIELKANGVPAEELNATLEDQKTVMDDIRSLMTELDSNSLQAIKSNLPKSHGNARVAYTLFPFMGFIGITIFVLILWQFKAQLRMQAQLQAANRSLTLARDAAVEASLLKSQFVANISHELRTPLAGVLGMSELLVMHPLDSEAADLSESVLHCAQHLLTLVNDLLDFSKLEADKMTLEERSFDLINLVAEVARFAEAEAAKKNVAVHKAVAENCPHEIVGDPTRIRQVLTNLADNAVKFTEKGTVTIAVEKNASDNAICFTVTDTGIGIAPEQHSRLFEPFVQGDGSTTRKYGGTGLGLSICQRLVHLMGGEIGFAGEPNAGARFWFTIPI